jgi:hypothetical protein
VPALRRAGQVLLLADGQEGFKSADVQHVFSV